LASRPKLPPPRSNLPRLPRARRARRPKSGHASASGQPPCSIDRDYDSYLAFKQGISKRYNLDFSLDFSLYWQTATPDGGRPVWLGDYYPNVTWRAFSNTAVGSGRIDVTLGQQTYFSKTDTGNQAARLGLITFPNASVSDNFSWDTLAYTHTFPGTINWLSLTLGQYNLFDFDPNEYAGNEQTNFISYPFLQDATATFPNAGLGSYVTAKIGSQFSFSAGFQGATTLSGRAISQHGFETGKYVPWANLQWTPTFFGYGIGIYSLLIYDQPFIEGVSSHSTGFSVSLSQQLSAEWAGFLRANSANGADTPIRTSIGAGGIRNDPFRINPTDQAGLAIAWNETNHNNVGQLPGGTRGGEWVTELYYNYTVFKWVNVTPDGQVFLNPALDRSRGTSAVFTLRTTLSF
jgi:Carbohydrate-selective porin, OprB family